jgi:hypothetical protein
MGKTLKGIAQKVVELNKSYDDSGFRIDGDKKRL